MSVVPADVAGAAPGESRDPAAAPGDDAPFNILVADDREENLLAFRSALAELGQNVMTARSGREALRHALVHDFAVILLDVNMPDADGFETASLLRQRQRHEATPIIFVTAAVSSEPGIARGYALGAVDYIFTPVPAEVLRAKVAAFVDIARRERRLRRVEEQLRLDAEQRAHRLESRLQSLLERLDVGVLRAVAGGRLTEANPALLRLLECERVDAASAALAAEPRLASLARALADPAPGRQEVAVTGSDGSQRWIALTTGPDVTHEGAIEGLAVDVTAQRAAAETLAATNSKLQRSNDDLAQFACAASHDLQSPLRSIIFYAQMMKADHAELPTTAQDQLDRIVDAALRMEQMLRGLLEYSQADAAQDARISTDAEICLEAALANLRQDLVQTDARITRSPLPRVRIRPVQLTQLFQNLIGNSLKYAGRKGPRVAVEAQRDEGGWVFSVADDGPGIDARHHEKIFQLFSRLHGSDVPGVGVGLAICRKIVERHGGRISVESAAGAGTRVSFTLPD